MSNVATSPNCYALLIGIDHYPSNPWYKSLQGCVRNINLVDDWLQRTLQSRQIYKLLSYNPDNSFLLDVKSAEEFKVLPTYANIVNAFKKMTAQAQSGDLVYIPLCRTRWTIANTL